MTCRELTEFVDAWLERKLDPEVVRAFEAHLEECAPCVAYLASYETIVRATRRAHDEPGHEEMPEELVRAILAARKGE